MVFKDGVAWDHLLYECVLGGGVVSKIVLVVHCKENQEE